VTTATVRFNIITGQMTEMSQRRKKPSFTVVGSEGTTSTTGDKQLDHRAKEAAVTSRNFKIIVAPRGQSPNSLNHENLIISHTFYGNF